ncbi:aminotransferase class I/II-fold pyridoxal phosphate-dependent enzyme [Rhizosaccharibacter radicis]|uniref:8-amino-7-oxononanoate synthase n=1 Tax=Rhizosaccharibacter radicis TaxID=2782605 RepID=A0ABT1VV54_9PROT|nr:8-amino-7-oxononanoate synthase [Acetobacteraceae bacterium KSS12]
MSGLDPFFLQTLHELSHEHIRRVLRPLEVADVPPGHVGRDGRTLLNLSGNDYLGLNRHPLLAERAADWGRALGTGAGASRLVSGTMAAHGAVEDRVARWKNTEAALLFASGWQLNAAVLPALLRAMTRAAGGAAPLLFTDRLIHASLHQGAAASGVRQHRFRHNDLAHLSRLLDARAGEPGRRLIVTESVFSMDGDRADLAGLRVLADRHDAFLYVDEAHATGVLGPAGAGLACDAGGADLAMGTFSKAMGGFGAYLAGSRALCDFLLNTCSGFIHTTALPPTVLGAIDAALDLVPEMDAERARLQAMAARLRDRLAGEGFETGGSTTQIVPVLMPSAEAALDATAALEQDGVLGVAIRPPTVPPNGSRLRLALSAVHPADAPDLAVDALRRWRDARPSMAAA